jgi:hypothetical protein
MRHLRYTCQHAWFAAILLASGMFMLTSCEDIMDVNMNGDGTRNLVVEGSITTDTTAHQVVLSYTGNYFEKGAVEMASGAQVTISNGDTLFELHEGNPGIYVTDSNVYGVPGKTYTLNIKLPDNSTYTAHEKLNPCAAIDSIAQSSDLNIYQGYGYDVYFYAREPEPAGNYYIFLLYKDHVLYSDTITEVVFTDDEFINGMYVKDYPVYWIREVDMPQDSALITLEIMSVNKNYYDFLNALMLETAWKGSPWDGPPANVVGNISNGARGYFRASAIKRKSKTFYKTPRTN